VLGAMVLVVMCAVGVVFERFLVFMRLNVTFRCVSA